MDEKYKIAISYSHKDIEIIKIIGEEIKDVFEDGFFLDFHKPEELADADIFTKKLQNIFRTSDYSLVLYSENYKKGVFTSVEWEAIQQKAKRESPPHLFIININDCKLPEDASDDEYILLEVPGSVDNQWQITAEVRSRIREIIQNSIKTAIMKQSIAEKKQSGEYSLNIQTTFADGNVAKWNMDYDWNLLGSAYVDGRRIKKDFTWQDLWEYVKKEFLYLKREWMGENSCCIKLHFNCHLSIAYKLGQVYGDLGRASGNRNLILESSNSVKANGFSLEPEADYQFVEDFCYIREGTNEKSDDMVCIVSIKPSANERILETVRAFLREEKQDYCKVCMFVKDEAINDSVTLESLAEYLREKMNACRAGNKCRIHLFPDTTAPLMFVLGARTIVPGEIYLYEYNREKDSYEMSLKR